MAANQELNHGRLAMLAVLELFRHDAQSLVGGMYAGDPVMGRMITGYAFSPSLFGNCWLLVYFPLDPPSPLTLVLPLPPMFSQPALHLRQLNAPHPHFTRSTSTQ